jgi:transcriptional regulator with XRE-family HTH domain
MKTTERERARDLRREEGRSIKEIARLLGVSQSSVSRWVDDVRLTDVQHHAERQREVEDFWLDVVALPRTCLTKSTVNRYSSWSNRKRLNVLPYGTCRLSAHRTQLVQSIFGAIQEYGGFERPEWLG